MQFSINLSFQSSSNPLLKPIKPHLTPIGLSHFISTYLVFAPFQEAAGPGQKSFSFKPNSCVLWQVSMQIEKQIDTWNGSQWHLSQSTFHLVFHFFSSPPRAQLFFSYFLIFSLETKKPRVTFPAWANFARSLANRDKHFLAFPHLPLKNFTRLSPRTSFPSSFVDRLEKYLFGGVFPFLFIWRENEKPPDDFHLGLGSGRFFPQIFHTPLLDLTFFFCRASLGKFIVVSNLCCFQPAWHSPGGTWNDLTAEKRERERAS